MDMHMVAKPWPANTLWGIQCAAMRAAQRQDHATLTQMDTQVTVRVTGLDGYVFLGFAKLHATVQHLRGACLASKLT